VKFHFNKSYWQLFFEKKFPKLKIAKDNYDIRS